MQQVPTVTVVALLHRRYPVSVGLTTIPLLATMAKGDALREPIVQTRMNDLYGLLTRGGLYGTRQVRGRASTKLR